MRQICGSATVEKVGRLQREGDILSLKDEYILT